MLCPARRLGASQPPRRLLCVVPPPPGPRRRAAPPPRCCCLTSWPPRWLSFAVSPLRCLSPSLSRPSSSSSCLSPSSSCCASSASSSSPPSRHAILLLLIVSSPRPAHACWNSWARVSAGTHRCGGSGEMVGWGRCVVFVAATPPFLLVLGLSPSSCLSLFPPSFSSSFSGPNYRCWVFIVVVGPNCRHWVLLAVVGS